VDTHDSEGKVLHLVLKAEDIGVIRDEVNNHLISGLVGRLYVDVATKTTGVVAQTIGLRVRWHALRSCLDGT
jgi:hypothetical protein